MDLLSAEHLAVLAITAVAAVALAGAARAGGQAGWVEVASRALALALLASYLALWTVDLARGDIGARSDLPLDLSDVVVFVAAYALWRPSPLAFELTYFWAFTATVQALATPDLDQGFPGHRWWWFVIAHAGVVVAALLLAWGRQRTPRPGAVRRAFVASLIVAGAAALVDLALGANYMFLRRAPTDASLIDVMGPWPWYIAAGAALALALFWLLDQPFRQRRSMGRP